MPQARHQNILLGLVIVLSLTQYKALSELLHPALAWLGDVSGSSFFDWLIDLRIGALLWTGAWFWWLGRSSGTHTLVRWPLVAGLIGGTLVLSLWLIFGSSIWVQTVLSLREVLVLVGVAVLVEEWWFRGVAYNLIRQRSSTWATIVFTAVLFSLAHWQYHAFRPTAAALAQLAYTLPLGIIFGFLRAETDRLWLPIALHMMINSLAALHSWL